jgi:hypothetical protein
MQELFILDPAYLEKLKPEIQAKLSVVQEIPPRMMVVEGDPADIRSAAKLPGVQPCSDVMSADALGSLSDSERLFFDSWKQRTESKKDRKFEGLNWGAKGFEGP